MKLQLFFLNLCMLESSASFARTVLVSEGSRINVYILLDTSGSITKQDFDLSRNATIALIRKVCVSQAYLLQQVWVKDRDNFFLFGGIVFSCLPLSVGLKHRPHVFFVFSF